MSRLDRDRSALDRVVEGVITLVVVALGVDWALSILVPAIPYIFGALVVAAALALLGWWLRHRDSDRYW